MAAYCEVLLLSYLSVRVIHQHSFTFTDLMTFHYDREKQFARKSTV